MKDGWWGRELGGQLSECSLGWAGGSSSWCWWEGWDAARWDGMGWDGIGQGFWGPSSPSPPLPSCPLSQKNKTHHLPSQIRIPTTPATAEPPGAALAIQNILIHTTIVGGLQAGPQVVGAGARQRGDDHLARERGEGLRG